jgi:hypothetical protein
MLVLNSQPARGDDAGNTKGTAKNVRNAIVGKIEKCGDVDWYKQWYNPGDGYTTIKSASGTLIGKGGYRVYFYKLDGTLLHTLTVTKAFSGKAIRISHDHFFAKVVAIRSGATGSYNIQYTVHNPFQ